MASFRGFFIKTNIMFKYLFIIFKRKKSETILKRKKKETIVVETGKTYFLRDGFDDTRVVVTEVNEHSVRYFFVQAAGEKIYASSLFTKGKKDFADVYQVV